MSQTQRGGSGGAAGASASGDCMAVPASRVRQLIATTREEVKSREGAPVQHSSGAHTARSSLPAPAAAGASSQQKSRPQRRPANGHRATGPTVHLAASVTKGQHNRTFFLNAPIFSMDAPTSQPLFLKTLQGQQQQQQQQQAQSGQQQEEEQLSPRIMQGRTRETDELLLDSPDIPSLVPYARGGHGQPHSQGSSGLSSGRGASLASSTAALHRASLPASVFQQPYASFGVLPLYTGADPMLQQQQQQQQPQPQMHVTAYPFMLGTGPMSGQSSAATLPQPYSAAPQFSSNGVGTSAGPQAPFSVAASHARLSRTYAPQPPSKSPSAAALHARDRDRDAAYVSAATAAVAALVPPNHAGPHSARLELLEYLQSERCALFSAPLQVLGSELDALLAACGHSLPLALRTLHEMDAHQRRFESFPALLEAARSARSGLSSPAAAESHAASRANLTQYRAGQGRAEEFKSNESSRAGTPPPQQPSLFIPSFAHAHQHQQHPPPVHSLQPTPPPPRRSKAARKAAAAHASEAPASNRAAAPAPAPAPAATAASHDAGGKRKRAVPGKQSSLAASMSSGSISATASLLSASPSAASLPSPANAARNGLSAAPSVVGSAPAAATVSTPAASAAAASVANDPAASFALLTPRAQRFVVELAAFFRSPKTRIFADSPAKGAPPAQQQQQQQPQPSATGLRYPQPLVVSSFEEPTTPRSRTLSSSIVESISNPDLVALMRVAGEADLLRDEVAERDAARAAEERAAGSSVRAQAHAHAQAGGTTTTNRALFFLTALNTELNLPRAASHQGGQAPLPRPKPLSSWAALVSAVGQAHAQSVATQAALLERLTSPTCGLFGRRQVRRVPDSLVLQRAAASAATAAASAAGPASGHGHLGGEEEGEGGPADLLRTPSMDSAAEQDSPHEAHPGDHDHGGRHASASTASSSSSSSSSGADTGAPERPSPSKPHSATHPAAHAHASSSEPQRVLYLSSVDVQRLYFSSGAGERTGGYLDAFAAASTASSSAPGAGRVSPAQAQQPFPDFGALLFAVKVAHVYWMSQQKHAHEQGHEHEAAVQAQAGQPKRERSHPEQAPRQDATVTGPLEGTDSNRHGPGSGLADSGAGEGGIKVSVEDADAAGEGRKTREELAAALRDPARQALLFDAGAALPLEIGEDHLDAVLASVADASAPVSAAAATEAERAAAAQEQELRRCALVVSFLRTFEECATQPAPPQLATAVASSSPSLRLHSRTIAQQQSRSPALAGAGVLARGGRPSRDAKFFSLSVLCESLFLEHALHQSKAETLAFLRSSACRLLALPQPSAAASAGSDANAASNAPPPSPRGGGGGGLTRLMSMPTMSSPTPAVTGGPHGSVSPQDVGALYAQARSGLFTPLVLAELNSEHVSLRALDLDVPSLAAVVGAYTAAHGPRIRAQKLLLLTHLTGPRCAIFPKPVALADAHLDLLLVAARGSGSAALRVLHGLSVRGQTFRSVGEVVVAVRAALGRQGSEPYRNALKQLLASPYCIVSNRMPRAGPGLPPAPPSDAVVDRMWDGAGGTGSGPMGAGAGVDAITHVLALHADAQGFASWAEVSAAVCAAHLSARSSATEADKLALLTHLTSPLCTLWTHPLHDVSITPRQVDALLAAAGGRAAAALAYLEQLDSPAEARANGRAGRFEGMAPLIAAVGALHARVRSDDEQLQSFLNSRSCGLFRSVRQRQAQEGLSAGWDADAPRFPLDESAVDAILTQAGVESQRALRVALEWNGEGTGDTAVGEGAPLREFSSLAEFAAALRQHCVDHPETPPASSAASIAGAEDDTFPTCTDTSGDFAPTSGSTLGSSSGLGSGAEAATATFPSQSWGLAPLSGVNQPNYADGSLALDAEDGVAGEFVVDPGTFDSIMYDGDASSVAGSPVQRGVEGRAAAMVLAMQLRLDAEHDASAGGARRSLRDQAPTHPAASPQPAEPLDAAAAMRRDRAILADFLAGHNDLLRTDAGSASSDPASLQPQPRLSEAALDALLSASAPSSSLGSTAGAVVTATDGEAVVRELRRMHEAGERFGSVEEMCAAVAEACKSQRDREMDAQTAQVDGASSTSSATGAALDADATSPSNSGPEDALQSTSDPAPSQAVAVALALATALVKGGARPGAVVPMLLPVPSPAGASGGQVLVREEHVFPGEELASLRGILAASGLLAPQEDAAVLSDTILVQLLILGGGLAQTQAHLGHLAAAARRIAADALPTVLEESRRTGTYCQAVELAALEEFVSAPERAALLWTRAVAVGAGVEAPEHVESQEQPPQQPFASLSRAEMDRWARGCGGVQELLRLLGVLAKHNGALPAGPDSNSPKPEALVCPSSPEDLLAEAARIEAVERAAEAAQRARALRAQAQARRALEGFFRSDSCFILSSAALAAADASGAGLDPSDLDALLLLLSPSAAASVAASSADAASSSSPLPSAWVPSQSDVQSVVEELLRFDEAGRKFPSLAALVHACRVVYGPAPGGDQAGKEEEQEADENEEEENMRGVHMSRTQARVLASFLTSDATALLRVDAASQVAQAAPPLLDQLLRECVLVARAQGLLPVPAWEGALWPHYVAPLRRLANRSGSNGAELHSIQAVLEAVRALRLEQPLPPEQVSACIAALTAEEGTSGAVMLFSEVDPSAGLEIRTPDIEDLLLLGGGGGGWAALAPILDRMGSCGAKCLSVPALLRRVQRHVAFGCCSTSRDRAALEEFLLRDSCADGDDAQGVLRVRAGEEWSDEQIDAIMAHSRGRGARFIVGEVLPRLLRAQDAPATSIEQLAERVARVAGEIALEEAAAAAAAAGAADPAAAGGTPSSQRALSSHRNSHSQDNSAVAPAAAAEASAEAEAGDEAADATTPTVPAQHVDAADVVSAAEPAELTKAADVGDAPPAAVVSLSEDDLERVVSFLLRAHPSDGDSSADPDSSSLLPASEAAALSAGLVVSWAGEHCHGSVDELMALLERFEAVGRRFATAAEVAPALRALAQTGLAISATALAELEAFLLDEQTHLFEAEGSPAAQADDPAARHYERLRPLREASGSDLTDLLRAAGGSTPNLLSRLTYLDTIGRRYPPSLRAVVGDLAALASQVQPSDADRNAVVDFLSAPECTLFQPMDAAEGDDSAMEISASEIDAMVLCRGGLDQCLAALEAMQRQGWKVQRLSQLLTLLLGQEAPGAYKDTQAAAAGGGSVSASPVADSAASPTSAGGSPQPYPDAEAESDSSTALAHQRLLDFLGSEEVGLFAPLASAGAELEVTEAELDALVHSTGGSVDETLRVLARLEADGRGFMSLAEVAQAVAIEYEVMQNEARASRTASL